MGTELSAGIFLKQRLFELLTREGFAQYWMDYALLPAAADAPVASRRHCGGRWLLLLPLWAAAIALVGALTPDPHPASAAVRPQVAGAVVGSTCTTT